MSYISAIRTGEEVLIWERVNVDDRSERELKRYQAPYYFYTRANEGEYKSMYGDDLERHDFATYREMQAAKSELKSHGNDLFESDIPPELKILSERYYDVPAPTLHTTFLDIEVDYLKEVGFASVKNPYAPINSVALYHTHQNRYVVYAVPPNLAPHQPVDGNYLPGPAPEDFVNDMRRQAPFMEKCELEVTFCLNEKELLMYLLTEIEDSDAICGWNSDFFDVPYIGKRLMKIGPKYFGKLSFDFAKNPTWREVEMYGNKNETLDLSGRISADYMVLFKKYEMAERPSYKLASIADEILPDLPKIEYEGTLADLYRSDFAGFVRYNIRDTEILHGLEDRLGYVDLANQMMHLSTATWKHVGGTLKLAELAVINYCHHVLDGLVVNDFSASVGTRIKGAFVLLPQVGLHEGIGSIDINGLYPSGIRSVNISPETLMGQFLGDVEDSDEIAIGSLKQLTMSFDDTTQVPAEFRGESMSMRADEWREFLTEQRWSVSGYGTIFNQNQLGIIPMILADWIETRKKYQALKTKAKAEADAILSLYEPGAELHLPKLQVAVGEHGFDGSGGKGHGSPVEEEAPANKTEGLSAEHYAAFSEWKIKATYYDKLQYTYKIKLNSFYGALTNPYFRFFDSRMGESTTGTGRKILLHQCAKACEILDGEYAQPDRKEIDDDGVEHFGYSDKWSVIYGDTDSSYFRLPQASTQEKSILVADEIGNYVNDSFQEFMQQTFLCTDTFDDKIKCGREIVSDRGIFVQKKRYILHIIDNEGYKVDKLKVMGLDTKKTTLPKEISTKLNGFVERFLKGENWDVIANDIVDYKDEIEQTDDVMSIGLPKGIQNLEMYTEKLKEDYGTRLPGHVAAAICYNLCLKSFGDTESMPITSGMKIKVFYISQTIDRFKSIAIPVDIEQVPEWFTKEFKIDRQAHIERLVDNPLLNIIKAVGKEVPSKQGMLVDDLLDF